MASPNSAPNVPTTTASSVTSPNASSNTPPVGNNASSVSSPSSSNAPSSSVSSVTPPVSSVKPVGTSTVKPSDAGYFLNGSGNCVYFSAIWNPFGESQCDPVTSLDTQQEKNDDETNAAAGDVGAQARLLVPEAKNTAALADQ